MVLMASRTLVYRPLCGVEMIEALAYAWIGLLIMGYVLCIIGSF